MYERENFRKHDKKHKNTLSQFQVWNRNNLMLPNRSTKSSSSRENSFVRIRTSIKITLTTLQVQNSKDLIFLNGIIKSLSRRGKTVSGIKNTLTQLQLWNRKDLMIPNGSIKSLFSREIASKGKKNYLLNASVQLMNFSCVILHIFSHVVRVYAMPPIVVDIIFMRLLAFRIVWCNLPIVSPCSSITLTAQ